MRCNLQRRNRDSDSGLRVVLVAQPAPFWIVIFLVQRDDLHFGVDADICLDLRAFHALILQNHYRRRQLRHHTKKMTIFSAYSPLIILFFT
jgi:hypothetical protein